MQQVGKPSGRPKNKNRPARLTNRGEPAGIYLQRSLEEKLRRDLNAPGGAVRSDFAEQAACVVCAAESVRVRAIVCIERLAAELEFDALGKVEVLHQRRVPVPEARSTHGSTARVARPDGSLRYRLE